MLWIDPDIPFVTNEWREKIILSLYKALDGPLDSSDFKKKTPQKQLGDYKL